MGFKLGKTQTKISSLKKTLYSTRNLKLRQRLRAVREERGVTQQVMATKLEKPQSFVSKYESGERRLDVIEFAEVCALLDVDAAIFLKELLADTAAMQC
jgi:transcriptional regulator with XRE-family HTH domain